MASVVLLRGVNVGGHKTFKPSQLAKELERYDVVNVGAAGTFVVRERVARARLRAEFARRLPFGCDIMICDGKDILELIAWDPFEGMPVSKQVMHFVNVLAKPRTLSQTLPLHLPSSDDACVTVLACRGQFVVGKYRREMQAISWLGKLEKMLGVSMTNRNWNTILTIGKVLERA